MCRVVEGDVEAYELLVHRHQAAIARLVARNVPADAVAEVAQDAFVSAYLSLPNFAPTSSFEGWLKRIALRCCANLWRRSARTAFEPLDEQRGESAPTGDDRELCQWALAQLDAEDREVLTLVYFEGLNVKECAEVLSWGESKVKVRAHRARARMREILGRIHPEREGKA